MVICRGEQQVEPVMDSAWREMGDFVLAVTTETDEETKPKERGAINGGLYKGTEPHRSVRFTIPVDGIRERRRGTSQLVERFSVNRRAAPRRALR
jgi:hypothetical protein